MKYLLILALITTVQLTAQISNDGLLSYYQFNGNAADSSGNNYNGTLVGGSFGEDENGISNSALLLNGDNEYLDLSIFAVPYRENLDQISIFFKVKFELTQNNQTILSLGNSGENIETNVFEIEYENSQFQVESETGENAINHELQIDEENTLFDNQWHNILILINGDSLTYCKDGEEIYTGLYIPSETNSSDLFLGCFGGNSTEACCFFGGFIDELQFYNRLIDKDELLVSIPEFANTIKVEVFPNPTNDVTKVKLDRTYGYVQIHLIDIQGNSLLNQELENISEFNISMPLSKGSYFLQIFTEEPRSNFKVMKIIKQ